MSIGETVAVLGAGEVTVGDVGGGLGQSERKVTEVFGEFNRKFTLFDRYVLDLSADADRTFDRRIALAVGVMLDTGERR